MLLFFAQEWCNGVLQNQFLFYTTSELLKSMMFRSSLPPLLWSLSLLIQLLRWNIIFTHFVCCYMYVNFLEQEKVFAREKSSTLPGIFSWTKQKHGCQGFIVLVQVVRSGENDLLEPYFTETLGSTKCDRISVKNK